MSPAPGTYNSVMNKSTKSFEFRSRPKSKKLDKSPGPSEYNPNDSIIRFKNQDVVISPLKRGNTDRLDFKVKGDSPGPGQYDSPNLDSVRSRAGDVLINPESKFSPYQMEIA